MVFSLFKKSNDPVYPLTWVTPQLAVGHAPMSYAELDSIKNQGIRAIMNLCMEMEALVEFEREEGFEVYYLPIMDEGLPELADLEKALDWLDECIYLGKKVLIHCRHGIGRTGTVVYSYLLRKGLDRKSAGKKMRGLRARPTEQPQKRFLHQYGKRETPLAIFEPTLIPQFKVELKPFFDRIGKILEKAEADISEKTPRCGKDHSRCCYGTVRVTLAEAVYLQYAVNTELTHSLRNACINDALHSGAPEGCGVIEDAGAAGDAACPLLKDGQCLTYDYRPAPCRVFDQKHSEIPPDLAGALQALSKEILALFLGEDAGISPPQFTLCDAVSGKFVQRFFELMAK
ncbi:MAG: protein-tyrosine phosphatase family protein [Thermodesulfobacteriota bacterium]